MVKEFSLSKSERLSSRKSISSLFETGQSIYVPPLRIIYQPAADDNQVLAMAVSVPKRLFKRAVDRNLLKRRIREAYRLNNKDLYQAVQAGERKLHLVIQYKHREISDYQTIEKAVQNGLLKLKERLNTRESD